MGGRSQLTKVLDAYAEEAPNLMPCMVREILLVSTLYDSFILEEDGRFSDKLLGQYMELHLSSPPRIVRASTAADALARLEERQFDLVIVMQRIADMTPQALARRVKDREPDLPVVMLAFESVMPDAKRDQDWQCIDRIFIWKGDNRVLLVLVKSIEDMMNVDHDTKAGLVRVIIVVEDSPVDYSAFLSLLYTEIMEQTRSLIVDSLNHLDRVRRMRARPKILLATTFEEAAYLFETYRDYLLGLISDVRMPRQGVDDPKAGLAFMRQIRETNPGMPILLQSAEADNREEALEMGVEFSDKNSPELLSEIRDFIRTHFGFGDFVFRGKDGQEIDRAGSMIQMTEAFARVPNESLTYHASRNHFSNWLMARGEFPLAQAFQLQGTADFDHVDDLRTYLVASFQTFLDHQQRGRITDFSRGARHLGRDFVRLGGGSLGGKGRGVAFIYTLLARSGLHERYPDMKLMVPRTTVVCTHEFDRFMEDNRIRERILEAETDDAIGELFLKSRISDEVHKDLEALLADVRYPLAVRSSSLLEDSQFQPFAGVYATFMLPNNNPSMRVRLRQLRRAIKLVYASTYSTGAQAYMHAIHHRVEEEKMAVLIQRLVGHDYGDRFYPTFSGVAQSYNYYPVRYMQPEDGIAHVALGLGRTVVAGGKALRFSPTHPHILPQMSTPDDALKNAQRRFFALDMTKTDAKITRDEEDTLVHPGLDVAEADGSLHAVGATYVADEHRIYDSIHRQGARLVNFAPVLKHGEFALSELLRDLLAIGHEAMGCPVEIEFAVNLAGDIPEFAVVQVRPLVTREASIDANLDTVDPDRVVLRSARALGNGLIKGLRDIIYVAPDRFDSQSTVAIADEVARMNAHLVTEARPYVLVGPGRWGTADRFLGIPVSWGQVSAARIIIEIGMDGFDVDPSLGTHFFHNITSLKVGYMSVDDRKDDESLDGAWLADQEVVAEGTWARHIRLDSPLEARLDGKTGRGVITR